MALRLHCATWGERSLPNQSADGLPSMTGKKIWEIADKPNAKPNGVHRSGRYALRFQRCTGKCTKNQANERLHGTACGIQLQVNFEMR